MFASCALCAIVTSRLAPLALLVCPLTNALRLGENASALHEPTWNGLERLCEAPSDDVSVESTDSGPQLVGLKMKLWRSTAKDKAFRRIGTPSNTVGMLAVAITRPEYRPTPIEARVTTVPRLNGPATAGTTIERPYGAPPYGPVRNAAPVNEYGSLPAPAAIVTVAILLAAGHAPRAASGSPHSGTEGIAPSRPGGSVVVICAGYCCASLRVTFSVKGL